MAIAITTDPRDYVLMADRDLPPDQQTIFKIKPLSTADRARIDDLIEIYEDGRTVEITDAKGEKKRIVPFKNPSRRYYETVSSGLVGWSNLRFADGTDCPFKDSQSENLNCLGNQIITELFIEIDSLSEPKKAELENFPSPPNG